ncbi:MAG: hypothetical protein DMG69_28250 [Acidobacteria bacterium]|nr:MAG: hypothetical protein DMG69_28250 [Acidobacteriota bacterium]
MVALLSLRRLLTYILIGIVLGTAVTSCPLQAQQKLNFEHLRQQKFRIMPVSYGDWVENGDLFSSKEAIEASFKAIHDYGSTHIYWRLLWEGHPIDKMLFYGNNLQERNFRLKQPFEGTPYAWNPHEIRYPLEVAHKLGMKFYVWVSIYNEGAPPAVAGEYWYQSVFVYEHPEFQLVDRTGKRYYYGVLEWAYPQARKYWVDEIQEILDKYDVDGVYLDARPEAICPETADEFGFNDPVVKEYERRYGVNILREDFDLEKWRALRGEYFTLLVKEISDRIHAKGKLFSLGISRGDYIGYPVGNMKLEWRKWIEEKVIDYLHLDEYGHCSTSSLSAGLNPSAVQPYGFVTDYPTERGLKPLDVAVREDYGPLCHKHGVKLYFRCYPYQPRPIENECCESRATMNPKPVPPGWCQHLLEMPEIDGVDEVAPFFLSKMFPQWAVPRREQRRTYPLFK